MNPYYPVLSLDEARAYEESVLGGDSGKTSRAMENAGRAIGAAIHDDYREIRPWPGNPEIHVLGGKGLNTGDALVACETLQAFLPGLQVTLVCTASTTEMNPLAGAVLERIRVSMGERFRIVSAGDYIQAGTRKVDVLLDGLYGHGFKPPLRPEAAQLLKQVNSRTDIALRVSVDLPSGMGADTDPDSFVADITCIPGVAKEPCFREANWPFTGRLRFLEIEPFLDQPVDENRNRLLASPRIHKSLNRLRPPRSDKRQYGHCLIIAGSSQMPGAALMATRAALQAGAGLVTTFAPSFVCRQIA
ncbi:MAG: NAD(P)H-hydrate epimerase, partial [Oceanipulchritudo sp.]